MSQTTSWLRDGLGDVRYAVRSFRRRPGFVVAAVGCLAIGIAANLLIFSILNSVLLRSMPYPEPDRIVMVRFTPPNQGDQRLGTNAGSFSFIRERSRAFDQMGELRITGFSVAPGSSNDAIREWVLGGWMSEGLPSVMGVQPVLGRWFSLTDAEFGIVISHRLWQRMFGGARDVLGQTLRMDLAAATIIGVMPPGYRTLNADIDVWRLQPDRDAARAGRSPNRVFSVFARMKPGVTVEQAQAEMNDLAGPLGDYMEMNRGWGIKVDSLRDAYVGYLKQPVLVLQGAVALLLLIACANVAGLLLAHGGARQREFATRAALGSSRTRTVRQLITESLLLSVTAGASGTVMAWAGIHVLAGATLSAYPDLQDVTLDLNVLAVAVAVSLATALVFGLVPALHASRLSVVDGMREAARGVTASARHARIRGLFVVAQLALTVVLVIGTSLLVRSLLLLNAVHPGLDARGVAAVQVPFPRALYKAGGNTPSGSFLVQFDARFHQQTERMRERLSSIPGVASVSVAMTPPLGGTPRRMTFRTEPGSAVDSRESLSAEWYPVSASYFETLRIPVLRGRGIAQTDVDETRPVAVINATMARLYWPNQDPVGRLLQVDLLDETPRAIVGVVGDVTQDRYQHSPQPQLYVPRGQLPRRTDMTLALDLLLTTFLVRTNGDVGSSMPAFQGAVRAIDPALPIVGVRTVEQYAASQLEELGQYTAVLGVFSGLSVALALVGIVGMMAHAVAQRTNEFGIRMALGARPARVTGLVLRHAAMLVTWGLATGTVASLALIPAMRHLLWGVTETDLPTLSTALVGLALVALVACYVPARRATKVDPVAALRAN